MYIYIYTYGNVYIYICVWGWSFVAGMCLPEPPGGEIGRRLGGVEPPRMFFRKFFEPPGRSRHWVWGGGAPKNSGEVWRGRSPPNIPYFIFVSIFLVMLFSCY